MHVVGLIGIVRNFHSIVVEYCDGGDLLTYLKKVKRFQFPFFIETFNLIFAHLQSCTLLYN